MALIAAMLVVTVLIAVVAAAAGGGPARAARLAAASASASASVSQDAHALLVGRFIDRSLRFRRNGALAGLVVLVAAIIVRAAATDDAEAGVRFDLLTLASIGLAGSIIGSIAAEGFRLRSRRGPRLATLEVRSTEDYRDPIADRRERLVAVMAAVGVAGSLVIGGAEVRAAVFGVAVAVLAGIRRWAIRRIALRPRPALTDDLRRADDELRRLAASAGVSRPMVTLAALLVAAQWGAVSAGATASSAVTDTLRSSIAVISWIGSVGAFVVAVRWWWLNRSFGLRAADPLAPSAGRGIARVVLVVASVLVLAFLVVLFARAS